MIIWRMREALDPANGELLQLPKDDELKTQLCAAKWSFTKQGIKIESKEDIIERLGRSPDDADATCMANINTPKRIKRREKINYPKMSIA